MRYRQDQRATYGLVPTNRLLLVYFNRYLTPSIDLLDCPTGKLPRVYSPVEVLSAVGVAVPSVAGVRQLHLAVDTP